MTGVEEFNLSLRFILELCTLAALAYFGVVVAGDPLLSVALGLGLPLIAALTWGRYVAPRAKDRLADPMRLGVEVVYFGSGVVGLGLAGAPTLAVLLSLAVAAHFGLMLRFKLR